MLGDGGLRLELGDASPFSCGVLVDPVGDRDGISLLLFGFALRDGTGVLMLRLIKLRLAGGGSGELPLMGPQDEKQVGRGSERLRPGRDENGRLSRG